MSRIKILPDILSNKIAAGEVVERPASVVKELMENAIDAGSSRIVIDVERGGRSLLKVSDNGSGMQRDEALLAIERYATSKVYTDQDLFSIRTLGFRGEALPSIAAVSRFSLITKEAGSDIATQIDIEGGKIRMVGETGAACGTTIIVKDLFYNVPARRKFLKTISTEMGHIADTVTHMALGWPAVQFRLLHNGRMVKSWAATHQSIGRITDVLGINLGHRLHTLRFRDDAVEISGWIASPDIWRTSAQKVFIYVNGRFVRNRSLQQALFEGFRGRLVKGRYPVAVVFLKVPFDRLDVNVHPTKHEVRFADQQRIYAALRETVERELRQAERPKWQVPSQETGSLSDEAPPCCGNAPETPRSDFQPVKMAPAGPQRASVLPGADRRESPVRSFDSKQSGPGKTPAGAPLPAVEHDTVPPLRPVKGVGEASEAYPSVPPVVQQTPAPASSGTNDGPASDSESRDELWETAFFRELTVIGQLHGTYILCESREGLIVIDQHAAHERIVYEDLKKKFANDTGRSQRLLIPETIEVGFGEAEMLLKILPELNRLGLEIEPFGGRTFVVKAVPELIVDHQIEPLVMRIVEVMASSGDKVKADELLEECLILMACHGAIRAHQPLSMQQMRSLLEQLDACENPSYCPHGRPLWIQWRTGFLEKAFARVV